MDILTENVFNSSNEMISNIINQEVCEKEFVSKPPVDDKLSDSNTVYKGKVSMLFVDMRNSTEFTDNNSQETVIKTYRSFLKTITYAIRLSGGFVRDYTGDGVLAVFCDDEEEAERKQTSEIKAVSAAKMVHTLINYTLNPLLTTELDGIKLACGIGISTGLVSITKVGMRGRESNINIENETGTIWIGSCTNHASKLCSVSKANEIIIDKKTFSAIDETDWQFEQRINGNKLYDCYCLSNVLLVIDEKIEQTPVIANIMSTNSFNAYYEIQQKLQEIQNEAEKLGALKKEIRNKEAELNSKSSQLAKKEESLVHFDEVLQENYTILNGNIYRSYKEIISKVFLKKDITRICREEFWNSIFDEIYKHGKEADISKDEIDKDICCYGTDIYKSLQNWEKAYDFLCLMAQHSRWISTYSIEEIVTSSNHFAKLKRILEDRLKDPLEHDVYESLFEGLKKLKDMGY